MKRTYITGLLIVLTALTPYTARAGLFGCTILSTQLLGPEQEQNIAVAPTAFEVGDFVGSDRFFRIVYECSFDSNPIKWGIREYNTPATTGTGLSVIWNNENLTLLPIFTTPQLSQYGLGITGYYYPTFLWSEVLSEDFSNINRYPTAFSSTPSYYTGNIAVVGIDFRFRFVKINNNLDAILNNTVSTPYPSAFPIATFSVVDDNNNYESPLANITAHIPNLAIMQRACTPFVETVTLPSVGAIELPMVGSTGSATDFRFTVRCPHNAAWFGYYVESAHGYEDEANGVIKIDPASVAKGIGLQITTRSISHPEILGMTSMLPNHQPIKFGPTNRYGGADVTPYSVTNNPLADEPLSDALSALPENLVLKLGAVHANLNRLTHVLAGLDEHAQQVTLAHMFFPGRRPVKEENSWISSRFGKRRDPFNTRLAFHSGIDFAAYRGTPIYASAGGKVVLAGNRPGYGRTNSKCT